MKLKLIVIVILSFCVIKCFSTFVVQSMDGNNDSNMILLSNNYFYDEIEMSIWQYESKTSSYLNVIPNVIDSLSFNDKYIVGYTNRKYFIIDIKNNKIEFADSIEDRIQFNKLLFKKIDEVSSLL
jgi:hypothetical protein